MLENKTLTGIYLWGFGIIFSTLFFSSLLLDQTLTPKFLAFSALGIISILLFHKKTTLYLNKDIITIGYIVYLFYCAISIYWSQNKAEAIFDVSRTALGFFFFFMTFNLFQQKKNLDEEFSKISIILSFILLFALLFQINTFGYADKYKITGVSGHKNLFASFLILNLFFLVNGIFKLKNYWKNAAIISSVLTLIMIYFLQSRGVWMGLVFGLALFVCILIYKQMPSFKLIKINKYLSLALLILITNIFFLVNLKYKVSNSISNFKSIKSASAMVKPEDQERLVLWEKTFNIIEKNLLFGIGPGNWQIEFPNETLTNIWRAEDLKVTFQRPHNDFLWILSELGLIGFNLILVCFLSLFILIIREINVQNTWKESMPFVLIIVFLCAFFTCAFFDFPKERFEHTIWLNIILALAYFKIYEKQENKRTQKTIVFHPAIPFFVVLVCFIISLYRFNGELNYKKMIAAKANLNYREVIKYADKSCNWVYSVDPFSVPIHWYKASALMAQGKTLEAKISFMTALKNNPFQRNVLNDLGSIYYVGGDKTNAKKYYWEANRVSPRFDEPKLNLAILYIKEKNYEMARFWYRKLNQESLQKNQIEIILKKNIQVN